jgi:hypothetical protein
MAQSGQPLKASIPFEFIVGQTTLPAGDYTVGSEFGSALLQISDSRDHVKATVLTNTDSAPANASESHLVFRVHGTKHYLASTWDRSLGEGREVKESRAEREMEIASEPTTQVVLLARK